MQIHVLVFLSWYDQNSTLTPIPEFIHLAQTMKEIVQTDRIILSYLCKLSISIGGWDIKCGLHADIKIKHHKFDIM